MSYSTRTARGLAALALTVSAVAVLAPATVAAPPSPSAAVAASCVNKEASGNYTQYVRLNVNAAHKGRWVGFRVTATVPGAVNSPKSRTITRHDSGTSWSDTFSFLTSGAEATSVQVEVEVLDKKGESVGSPASWNGACPPEAAG
jgi:hypothetical protein